MREISGVLACALTVGALAVGAAGTPANAGADGPTCYGLPATIVGTNASEVVRGTPGDDVIVARGGADVVYARGGSDRLCGNAGNDRLYGAEGDDRFFGGKGDDALSGGAGNDSLPGEPGDEIVGGGPGVDIVVPWGSDLDLGDHDRISTGLGADWIIVNSAAGGTTIDAGAGDDVVKVRTGSGAPTSLAGGGGRDQLELRLGDAADDELLLDQRADRFTWGEVTGRFSGWDEITLFGEMDLAYVGHESADLLSVFGNGAVTAATLGGNDGVWGFYNTGPYHLDGGEGDDDLVGGEGNDVLRGGPGSDFLDGQGGDDWIDGGTGIERYVSGHDGTDTAVDPDDDPAAANCLHIEIGFCAEPPVTP